MEELSDGLHEKQKQDISEDRHFWCLEMSRWLLAVEIIIIIIIIIIITIIIITVI